MHVDEHIPMPVVGLLFLGLSSLSAFSDWLGYNGVDIGFPLRRPFCSSSFFWHLVVISGKRGIILIPSLHLVTIFDFMRSSELLAIQCHGICPLAVRSTDYI